MLRRSPAVVMLLAVLDGAIVADSYEVNYD
jgi:hypothetical protein